MDGDDVNFQQLLERSQQLGGNKEITQRTPHQLGKKSKLGITHSPATKGQASVGGIPREQLRAASYLNQQGFDPDKHARHLEAINPKKTFERIEQVKPTDIQGYLRHEKSLILSGIIEECIRDSNSRNHQTISERFKSNWDQRKNKIFDNLPERRSTGPTSRKIPTSVLTGTSTSKSNIPQAYLGAVVKAVRSPKEGTLALYIKQGVSSIPAPQLDECWDLIHCLVADVTPTTNSTRSTELERKLLRNSTGYLESKFLEHMDTVILENIGIAQGGGKPSFINMLRSYVRVRKQMEPQNFKDCILDNEGLPVWALVFFCLRVGQRKSIKALLEATKRDKNSNEAELERQVVQWSENSGRAEDRVAFHTSFKQVRLNSSDVFQQVVFSIVSSAPLTTMPPEVIRYWQDWVWHQLVLVEQSTTIQSQVVRPNTLAELSATVRDYGFAYFSNNGKSPLVFVQVCLLTQQFELAVQSIMSQHELSHDAVHIALCLYHYGLMPSETGTSGDIVSILGDYISGLSSSETVCYLSLVRDDENTTGATDITTRDYAFMNALLKMHNHNYQEFYDACKNVPQSHNIDRIFHLVADEMVKQTRYEDAIQLFALCRSEDKVWEVRNKFFGRHLTEAGIEQHPIVATGYNEFGTVMTNAKSQFKTMWELMIYLQHIHAGDYASAHESIQKLQVMSLNARTHQTALHNLLNMPIDLQAKIPVLLETLMTAIRQLFLQACEYNRNDQYKVTMQQLREQSVELIGFAGMLQNHFHFSNNVMQTIYKIQSQII
ncbi:hypothetical protein PROFUN_07567 [Planoprotostelium fungivorum]|uniref:Nuclear pore protein n=1 Tax=Planoprotostelium fungivorum TaxID=1890364 RepID=A0A2P6NLT5_9EUKA|nr:hypothetical protein PROFUN_07567 [Planoprotostelium fungivorum]